MAKICSRAAKESTIGTTAVSTLSQTTFDAEESSLMPYLVGVVDWRQMPCLAAMAVPSPNRKPADRLVARVFPIGDKFSSCRPTSLSSSVTKCRFHSRRATTFCSISSLRQQGTASTCWYRRIWPAWASHLWQERLLWLQRPSQVSRLTHMLWTVIGITVCHSRSILRLNGSVWKKIKRAYQKQMKAWKLSSHLKASRKLIHAFNKTHWKSKAGARLSREAKLIKNLSTTHSMTTSLGPILSSLSRTLLKFHGSPIPLPIQSRTAWEPHPSSKPRVIRTVPSILTQASTTQSIW